MKWGGVLAILLSCGCDRVFGLTRPDGAPADGEPPPFDCTTVPTSLFCADFEEPAQVFFHRNMKVGLPTPMPDPTTPLVTLVTPGASSPTALSIQSQGGTYQIEQFEAAQTGKLSATFEIELVQPQPVDEYAFLRLEFDGTGLSSCFSYVGVFRGGLLLGEHCDATGGQTMPVASPLPTGFVTIALDLDLGSQQTTVKVGTAPSVMLPVGPAPATAQPRVKVGPEITAGIPAIKLDNIVVVATP